MSKVDISFCLLEMDVALWNCDGEGNMKWQICWYGEFSASPIGSVLIYLLERIKWWNRHVYSDLVSWFLRRFSCHRTVLEKWKVLVTQSCPTLCDPMDCSRPLTLSMEFSRQEYWSGLPFPSPGNLPDQVSHIAGRYFTVWATREAHRPILGEEEIIFLFNPPIRNLDFAFLFMIG